MKRRLTLIGFFRTFVQGLLFWVAPLFGWVKRLPAVGYGGVDRRRARTSSRRGERRDNDGQGRA